MTADCEPRATRCAQPLLKGYTRSYHVDVAGTLSRPEFEGLRRSAAMAPLDHQNVVRLIQAYDELLAERDQLVSTSGG